MQSTSFANRISTGLTPVNLKVGTYFHVHLVSDSTGETLAGVMRASSAQFDNILPLEHAYYLVRSQRQLQRVMREIENYPGLVLFTMSNDEMRTQLQERCKEMGMPCVAVLDPVLDTMSRYLGQELNHRIGAGRVLDADYFRRIDALNFAMAHDDGQGGVEISDADVVLVGISRTSKTPTCVYLANRGVKAANVPIVPHIPLPDKLFAPDAPLIIGLTVSVERLLQVRRNRLASMKESRETSYVDEDAIRAEILYANRMYDKYGWPVIDVTRRSVEETSAAVLNIIADRTRVKRD
jgi:[pyruvate, water dikinase]-phosphate phosphotransferase / [pyruvate, water dikinase] kinase